MAKFQRHVFVCTNERAPGDKRGDCASRGAHELVAELKQKLYARGMTKMVRPNKSGCLDQCEHGAAMVVYPEAVWYGHVELADLDEIVEQHLVRGCPVARLVIPDDQLTGRTTPMEPKGDAR